MLSRLSSSNRFQFILAAWWLCLCQPLFGQNVILQLRNGDRLTGKIVGESTNQVTLSTPWVKEVIIPLTEITNRTLVAVTNLVSTNLVAGGTNRLASTNVIVAGMVATPAPTKAPPPQRWHGEVQVGTDLGFSEKDRQLYYGRAKITYGREIAPKRFFKNTFDGNATYGRTDGITSANQATGTAKTDFDLTQRVFVYNLVGVGYDQVRKVDLQYEVGPGFGYHLLMLTNFVLNTEIGMDYQAQYYQHQKTLERYFYRLAEDAKWVISTRLSFDEKFEFFPVDDLQNFRLRFETNLRYTFLEKFILTLTVLDAYDTQPATGVAPNDLQIRSSLGIKF